MDEIRLPWADWKIERYLGHGFWGKVYEISHTDPSGTVERAALKIISIPQYEYDITFMMEAGADEESIRQYNQEILDNVLRAYSALMQLKGHRGIVRCDACESVPHENGIGWDVYIRMELLTPLVSVLNEKTFSEEEILHLGEDLCCALIACEEKNIIHHDVKPGNAFLNKNGEYKLGDFWIERNKDSTIQGNEMGTFHYMAPEFCKSQEYGPTADSYSLGLIMYWLLNYYRRPFVPVDRFPSYQETREANLKRINGREPIPDPVRGNEKLKQVVLKACSYEPEYRFQTAAEFLEALHSAAEDMEQRNEEKLDEDLRCQFCGSRISEKADYCMVCGTKLMNRNKTGRNGSLDEYGEVSYKMVYASPGRETLFPDNRKRYPFNFAEKKREKTARKKSIDSGPFDLFRRKK